MPGICQNGHGFYITDQCQYCKPNQAIVRSGLDSVPDAKSTAAPAQTSRSSFISQLARAPQAAARRTPRAFLAQWMALNWRSATVALPRFFQNVELVANSSLGDIMMTNGVSRIEYNPTRCAAAGSFACLYILAHELGHIYHKHGTASESKASFGSKERVGREMEADEYACSLLCDEYPEVAEAALGAVYKLWMSTPDEAGPVHPKNRERAMAAQVQWKAIAQVSTRSIRIYNDDHTGGNFVIWALTEVLRVAPNRQAAELIIKQIEARGWLDVGDFPLGEALRLMGAVRAMATQHRFTSFRIEVVEKTYFDAKDAKKP